MSIEQPKLPEESKNYEPKRDNPLDTESSQRLPENLNESAENPKENQGKVKSLEKNLKLEEIRQEVNTIKDTSGKGIDDGIKETVVIFQANELPTYDSCEGHIDENGLRPPYVEVRMPNKPERWKGVDNALEEIQPLKETDNEKFHEEYEKIMQVFSKKPETLKYKKWEEKNKKLTEKSRELLNEFYKDREFASDVKLQIEEGVEENPKIYSGGKDSWSVIENLEKGMSEDEKKMGPAKLEKYRAEMKEFTEFLKRKYFEGNPSERKSEFNDLETMRKLHEEEDKQKLQELREQLNKSRTSNEEKTQESPIRELLDNNPELAKIYNERSTSHKIVINESGKILSEGQTYEDSSKMRALVELADAIREGLPHVQNGYVRLWRGNRPDEVGHNPSYTNSLEGIALPFLRGYNGVLSYIDIPQEEAKKYMATIGSAKESEFILPSDVVKKVKIIGFAPDEADEIKKKAKPLSKIGSEDNGWTIV